MPNVCKDNNVLISKRNNKNTVYFYLSFGYVVYVLYITLFTLSAEMHVDFAVFKFFERIYNSEFILFDLTKEEIYIILFIM